MELKGQGYDAAKAAVAISDSPKGPFQFKKSYRPNKGVWPIDFKEEFKVASNNEASLKSWSPEWLTAIKNGMLVRRDFDKGQMSRDMTVYVDDLGEFRDFTAEELQYPEVVREYDGITLELSRPWDGDWYANIAYTNSDTIGNYEGTVKSDNGQDDAGITQDFDFPDFVEGSYGKLPNHRKHNFKFTGAKTFGNGLIGGISVSAISPRYYGCIGNHPISTVVYTDSSWYCNGELTPRGSQAQSSWVIDVDAMLSYKVPVSVGDLTLKVDVFNVFNMDAVVDLREYGETGGIVGNADPNYLKPTLYQTPRRVRLSATYRF